MGLCRNTLDLIVARSKEVFWRCATLQDDRLAITAGPDGISYPFVYTRDLSIFIRYVVQTGNLRTARQAVDYLLHVQSSWGEWVQRYDVAGQPKNDKLQEDNTPLALWAILNYLAAADNHEEQQRCEGAIRLGVEWITANLDRKMGLLFAHSSNHEDGINQGFDLWTNSACLRAVELAGAIYGWEEAKELASELRSAIFKHLVHDGRFVRTIDREHVRKTDADIILLAPFYFQILPAQHELLASSVDFLCERLFDAELGGYWRYEQDVYFPGPWILYSAMIARYFYTVGRRNEGDAIVQWIFANSQQGYLPEHLLTKEMFWKYRDHQVRRANNMPVEEMKEARLREIGKLDEQAQQCDVLYYACPLLWSHMETVAALLAGGYLSGFDLERDLYAASSG